MDINIETNEAIEYVDPQRYEFVESEKVDVAYTYHVDQAAETELELVATYQNGGRDYHEKIIKPERGHFIVTKENGEEFPYSVEIPEGIPHEMPVPDVISISYWRPYTAEEIEQRRKEQEAAMEKAEQRAAMLDELPETIASTDAAICELYEMMIGE